MLRWRIRSEPRDGAAIAWAALPFDALEQVRLRASQRVATAETGPHLRRRMGQSLDFKEHRGFVPGDDIRYVDWRASARVGGASDLLVRQFDAEDRQQITLVIDLGPTMALPEQARKQAVAVLALRALIWVAERGRDEVTVVAIGSERATALLRIKGRDMLVRAESWLREATAEPEDPRPTQTDDPALPLGGIGILISDFYELEDRPALVDWAQRMQRRHGFVVAVELDSWALETTPLRDRAVVFDAVGGALARAQAADVTQAPLEHARKAARDHVRSVIGALDFGGLARLRWTLDGEVIVAPSDWIGARFAESPDLANALVVRS